MPEQGNLQPKLEKLPEMPSKPEVKVESAEQPISPEQIKAKEDLAKQQQKALEGSLAEKEGGEPGAPVASMGTSFVAQKSHREEQIEDILEEDLSDFYIKMPPEKQEEFKTVGETTIREINKELDNPKFSIKRVLGLIKRWLSIIPAVNKFFIEQETKIKADAINKLRR